MGKDRSTQVCKLILKWHDQPDTSVYCHNEAEVRAQIDMHKRFSNFKKAVPKWYTPK